jgi:hypothetical protein
MPGANRTRRDRITGLSILGVAFLGSLCVSWWASVVSAPESSPEPAPPTQEGLVGFPKNVDAMAALQQAHGLTLRERVYGIVLDGVKSDGTVDVTAAKSEIRFTFDSARGDGPQPERPKGTLPDRTYCGRQSIRVTPDGIFAEPDEPRTSCRSGEGELPDPVCGPKEVWDKARTRGVKPNALARIEYYRSSAGPAWRFEERGGRHRFSVYGDCKRMLNGREARGF